MSYDDSKQYLFAENEKLRNKLKNKSRELQSTKAKYKSLVMKTSAFAVILSTVIGVTAIKTGIDFVADVYNDKVIDGQIEDYGTGFVEGSKYRVNYNKDYAYNFDVIGNAIEANENPEFAFYNSVKEILNAALSRNDKNRNLDDLVSELKSKGISSENFYFDFCESSTWKSYLLNANFLAVDEDITVGEERFMEYFRNMQVEINEASENLGKGR